MAAMAPRRSPRARRATPSASQAARRPAAVPRRRPRPGPVQLGDARPRGRRRPATTGRPRRGPWWPGRPSPSRPAGPRRRGQGGQGRMVVLLGPEPGAGDGGLGQRLPTTPAFAARTAVAASSAAARDATGSPSRSAMSASRTRPSARVLLVAAPAELVNGLLGDLAGFAEQAGGRQGAGAVKARASGSTPTSRQRRSASSKRAKRRGRSPFRAAAKPRLWQ